MRHPQWIPGSKLWSSGRTHTLNLGDIRPQTCFFHLKHCLIAPSIFQDSLAWWEPGACLCCKWFSLCMNLCAQRFHFPFFDEWKWRGGKVHQDINLPKVKAIHLSESVWWKGLAWEQVVGAKNQSFFQTELSSERSLVWWAGFSAGPTGCRSGSLPVALTVVLKVWLLGKIPMGFWIGMGGHWYV